MFGTLTESFQGVFSRITGRRKLSEEAITDAIREVRMALLEADVHYGVAKKLVKRIKEKALGETLLKSVKPGEQFIKIVHDELIDLMGGEPVELDLKQKPAVWMVCGLQGTGKTTHCAKLAHYFKKNGKGEKPLLVACDLQRPAAIQQLQTLGKQIDVPVYHLQGEQDPVVVARQALELAKNNGHDLVILDTAGRLHVDDELMRQLEQLRTTVKPDEVLFVASAATGQDAVNTAKAFNERIEITGSILTMLDGNTRGGAAISIGEVTGKPLCFEGVGEKVEDLQPFNPRSMADRILGMGDTINLVRKAQEHFKEEDSKVLEEKLRKASFTYDDYLQQMQAMKKMGPLKGLLQMMPGMNKLPDMDAPEREMKKVEAIILSMTLTERRELVELIPNRRRRLASGSGTTLADVNKLVKSFKQMKQMMKKMPNMKKMEQMMGGTQWR